ncbi:MAG: LamG-like jellyroll fold domain-containing protein, partial [Candidatus Nanoarchaeia archaeon]
MAKRQRQQRTSDRFGLIEIVLLLFFVVVLFNPQGGLTGLVGLEIVVPPGGTVEINLDAYFSEGYTYLATEGYGMDVVVEGSNLVVTAEPDFLGSTNLSVIGALGDTVETRSFTVQVEAGWNSVELAALNSPVSVSGEVVNEINLLGYSRAIVTADSDAFDDFIADETYIQGIGPQNDGMVVSSNGNQFDIVLSEQGFLKLAGDPGVSSIQEYEELSFGTSGFSTQAVGVANVTLVSSSGNNISADNLTVVFDANQSGVKNITNWFRNGSSVTLFNMPFENIGSDAGTRDYSGFGSDASENGGIAWSATGGHDGRGAYTYDGIDDYLSVPADVKWNFSGNFTILAWVNLGSLNRNFVKSVSNEDWNSASTNDWAFNVGSDGRMAFYVKNVGVGSSTATVSTNTWTHVAVVRDSGDIKFFKDGAATTNNIKFSTNVTAGNTQALQIGRIQTNLDFNMDGEIDELMIFNRTLSPEQIFTIYTNQSHIIVSNETVVGDIWSATVTPNDGIADGITVQSNNVTIAAPFVNTVPNITSIVLNATSVGNLTTDNLTVFFTTVDVDGNATKNITNWFRNGASITLLNMPFENNGSNSGILDHSGVGANGSETNGVVWSGTSGFDGRGAYEFDGLDDYLTIPASDRWNLTDGFTITVWVNLDTLNRNIVKSVSSQDWNTAATNDWAVNIGGDGRPAFNVKNVGASSGTDSVSTNVWTHLAIVRQVNGDIRFYKDGSLSPVGVALSVNGTIGNNQVLEIGRIESTLDFNMDGHLDELTIWNRTLSAEQILALYQNRTDLIVSNETVVGDIWSATVTPNDGQEDGLTVQSNNLTVLTPANTPPNITSILLNTTTGANLTSENLTVHFTVVDDDGNTTTNITNWFRNGTSVLPLNMPFEGGSNSTFTRDYTPFANDGVVTNAVFNASGGYDGLGSYIFDGTGDYITVADDNSLDVGTGSSTFTAWVLTSSSSITFIMSHGQGGTAVLRTIGVKASGRIDARIEDSGTTQIISTDDGSTFNDGQWHHIAVVFDRGNDVLVRYLDGIQ